MKTDSGKGKIAVLRTIGFSKPRCFQRLGHFAPLYFSAYGGKIQATRCAVGR